MSKEKRTAHSAMMHRQVDRVSLCWIYVPFDLIPKTDTENGYLRVIPKVKKMTLHVASLIMDYLTMFADVLPSNDDTPCSCYVNAFVILH